MIKLYLKIRRTGNIDITIVIFLKRDFSISTLRRKERFERIRLVTLVIWIFPSPSLASTGGKGISL